MSTDLLVGKYTIKRQIGKGSYGTVFLVEYSEGKKQYVMKNINLKTSSAKNRLAAEQEASLLSCLQHPNIVSYKESFQDSNGVLHIVMSYCEGGDLSSRLKYYGGMLLSETRVIEWFVQISLALQYLHERNILHRDLKTQNIFLSKNDIVKVGDLGIARVLDGTCDLAHTIIGTPYYMSPELFANQPYNQKSDIWALGCCVYEMASLKHAFSARNIEVLMFKVVQGKVSPIPADYSSELGGLVQQMMARNPEHRPSVQQILRMPFIRKHIRMFIERTSSRKRKIKPVKSRGLQQAHRRPSCDQPIEEVAGGTNAADQQSASGDTDVHEEDSAAVCHLGAFPQRSRPLPPSPKATEQVMSSARQRRRKNKQHEYLNSKGVPTNQPSNLLPPEDMVDSSAQDFSPRHCGGIGEKSEELGKCAENEDMPDNPVDEVDDFYTLLDSTLHLPEYQTTACLSAESKEAQPTIVLQENPSPAGRLADRIRALRLECETALGVDKVSQVLEVLASVQVESEQAEGGVRLLLGSKNCDLYLAKLQELNLCERSLMHDT